MSHQNPAITATAAKTATRTAGSIAAATSSTMRTAQVVDGNGKQGKAGIGYKNPPADSRFKPGQSGNPAGKPPGPSFTRMLREELERSGKDKPDEDLARRVVLAMIERAMSGDVRAAELIWERLDGKVPDRVENVQRTIRARFPWEATEDHPNGNGNGSHPPEPSPGAGDDSALTGTLPRRRNGKAGR